MTCYHPLFASRLRGSDDKRFYNFHNVDFSPEYKLAHPELEFTQVPCQNCIGCRLDYSRQWADRCMLEAKEYKFNYFLTLTYDNENVPISEKTGTLTLKPDDVSKFMKNLRRYFQYHYGHDNIRFYACGEYGDQTHRPHYHIICYNLPIPDLRIWYIDKKGSQMFRSQILDDIWQNGIVGIADVTWETCAYVARYVIKKQKGPSSEEFYKLRDEEKEFVRMSRNPGIAKNYFDIHKNEMYHTDEIWLKSKKGPMKTKPFRYYDKLYDLEFPELMEQVKDKRKRLAKWSKLLQDTQTTLNEEQRLLLAERLKEKQANLLKRENALQ